MNPADLVIDTVKSRPWSGIVWHHSATKDGITNDWEAIRKYHTSYRVDHVAVTAEEYFKRKEACDWRKFELPWAAIAYHGGVERINGTLTYLPGRPLSIPGAHAGVSGNPNTYNAHYLGLCAVGNFDKTAPDADLWTFCLGVTKAFQRAYINILTPDVIGHREVFDRFGIPRQKTCPGTAWDIDKFRSDLG